MKRYQLLSALAAVLLLSASIFPLTTAYADDGTASDETNQPSDDKSDTDNDSWQQIGGGNNGANDGSGDLKDLETQPSQPTQPTQPTQPETPSTDQNQSSNKPADNTSNSSSSTTKPSSNASSSNKTQTSSNHQKPQSTNRNVNSAAESEANESSTPAESNSESVAETSVEAKQDESVATPAAGTGAKDKSFAIDFRLAGIIAAIVIVVCGLAAVIFINLRRNHKADDADNQEDLEEAWTTDETVADDFEFPAIDLDAEEKKIKTTKAAKAEAKAEAKTVKAEKKSAKKSDKE